MRKKGILSLLIILITLVVLTPPLLNHWIKKKIITYGESINGAKVELKKTKITFIPFGIRWEGFKIANPTQPMQNRLECDNGTIAINIKALFKKKLIIEDITGLGIKTNTKRKISGELEKITKKESKKSSSKPSQSKEVANKKENKKENIQLESMIKLDQLSMEKDYQTIKTKLEENIRKTMEDVKSTTVYDEEQNKIDTQLKNLKSFDINNIKSFSDITKKANTFNTIKESINKIQKDIQNKQALINNQREEIQAGINQLKQSKQKDLNRIQNTLNMTKGKQMKRKNTLFTGNIQSKLNEYLGYYHKLLPLLKKLKSKKEPENKKKRMEGITVDLSPKESLPLLWIKKVNLSKKEEKETLQIKIQDISSDQNKTKKITTLLINQKKENNSELKLKSTCDLRQEKPITKMTLQINKMPFQSPFIQSSLFNLNSKVNLIDKDVNGQVSMKLKQISFSKDMDPTIKVLLNNITESTLSMRLSGQIPLPKIAIHSDLDRQFNLALNKVYKEKQEKIRKDLESQLDTLYQEKEAGLNDLFNQFNTDAKAKLSKEKEKLNQVKKDIP